MTEISRPWNGTTVGDAGPYSDTQWQTTWKDLMLGFLANSGVLPVSNGTSGNKPLWVQADSPASASVDVLAGSALVAGTWYNSSATENIPIAANASGNDRIDLLVLRNDYVAQEVRLLLRQGTPAATPAAPTLVQSVGVTWEIPLAEIYVSNGFVNIQDSDITWAGDFAVLPPLVIVPDMLNAAGADIQAGQPVKLETSNDRALNDLGGNTEFVLGTAVGRILSTEYGSMALKGMAVLESDAAVSRGAALKPSSTAGLVTPEMDINAYAIALETLSGAGKLLALIDHPLFEWVEIVIEDQKSSGTNGGTATIGAWTTHTLNTIVKGSAYFTSLAANVITLPAGYYRAEISMVHGGVVNGFMCRFRNTSDGSDAVVSESGYDARIDLNHEIDAVGEFKITAAKTFELQYYGTTTGTANISLGNPSTVPSYVERFARVRLFRRIVRSG